MLQEQCHEVDASVHGCNINNINLTHLSYGNDAPIQVRLHDDQCADIITVNILIAGSGCLEQGGQNTDISPNKGIIFDSTRPFVGQIQGYRGMLLTAPGHEMRETKH